MWTAKWKCIISVEIKVSKKKPQRQRIGHPESNQRKGNCAPRHYKEVEVHRLRVTTSWVQQKWMNYIGIGSTKRWLSFYQKRRLLRISAVVPRIQFARNGVRCPEQSSAEGDNNGLLVCSTTTCWIDIEMTIRKGENLLLWTFRVRIRNSYRNCPIIGVNKKKKHR